jgi:hypothetical protein
MVEVSPMSHVFLAAPPSITLKQQESHTIMQYLSAAPNVQTLHHQHTAGPPQRVVYILKPEVRVEQSEPQLPTQPLPQAEVAVVPISEPVSNGMLPLDLSISSKQRHDSAASNSSFFEIGLGPRSNSCSSTSSSILYGGCGEGQNGRRKKRKDQNKAAAHSYRQRKKSFSEFVETEHEKLVKRNTELKGRRAQLEGQIKNMRALLDETARKEKEIEQAAVAAAAAEAAEADEKTRRRNLSAMAAVSLPPPPPPPPLPTMVIRPRSMSDVNPLMLPQHPSEDVANALGVMRERKNTWPLSNSGGASAAAAVATAAAVAAAASTFGGGRERKKEQNKLASRRFRQRRKLETNHSEHEGTRLEARNKRLREACEEMESKIRLLKDIMYNKNNNNNRLNNDDNANANEENGTTSAATAATFTTTSTSTSSITTITTTTAQKQ